VLEHEQHVRNDSSNEFMIKATDISKTYSTTNLMAVCQNTFGVKKGEILGLLGPNGAGKSTTFSMMALDIGKTSGDAQLMSQRVEDINVSKKGAIIGLCP
jgi:ABC-type multidrug transport system ATPase subunit